jgi:hypothetical protein
MLENDPMYPRNILDKGSIDEEGKKTALENEEVPQKKKKGNKKSKEKKGNEKGPNSTNANEKTNPKNSAINNGKSKNCLIF